MAVTIVWSPFGEHTTTIVMSHDLQDPALEVDKGLDRTVSGRMNWFMSTPVFAFIKENPAVAGVLIVAAQAVLTLVISVVAMLIAMYQGRSYVRREKRALRLQARAVSIALGLEVFELSVTVAAMQMILAQNPNKLDDRQLVHQTTLDIPAGIKAILPQLHALGPSTSMQMIRIIAAISVSNAESTVAGRKRTLGELGKRTGELDRELGIIPLREFND